MIPVELTVKNFMSYGEEEQVLPFEGIHVACLSGDNGNGKSALLDAMTWALWGKTRASSVQSVSEDDLIRRNADEMEVRFEFELDEQRYRVVRKRKRGKTGDWQLAQRLDDGQYVPIGGGVKEVGKQITQLLSMEYDTFLSSAYLQQGHADEFTRQKPAQRKQILAEILGLGRYDRLEARAREKARELKTQMDDIDGQIRILEGSIGRRQEFEVQLTETRAVLAALESEQAEQEKRAADWREQKLRLEAIAHQKTDLEEAAKRLEGEVGEATEARSKQQERLRRIQEVLHQRDAILGDYEALQQARRKREQLEPEIDEFNRKTSERQTVVGAIEIESTRLQGELNTLEHRAQMLEKSTVNLQRVEKQLALLEVELGAEQEILRDFAAQDTELEQRRQEFESLKARNKELSDNLKEVDEVLELLERPQAACPVCESDLSGVKRDRVVARQTARRDAMLSEQAQVQRDGRIMSEKIKAAQTELKRLSEIKDRLTAKRSQMPELLRQRESLICAPVELEAVRKQFADIRRQLANEDFAHPKRLHKKRIEQELERLTLVKAEYENVSTKARTLANTELRYATLQKAEESIRTEEEELERRERLAASKQEELERQQEKIAALNTRLSGYAEIERNTELAEAELFRLNRELTEKSRAEGSLLGYLKDCARSEQQRGEKEAERKKVHQDYWVYDKLAGCFGKKGIQALIIENAIPEIEEEANDLLARMTDNGMQVRFLTTRAGRSQKNEIETLDISITDDAGPRPYELFSGGEAFRVNFAIRIALSRLLAHRSGARLQTLILDEGFGTQDGKGREKLVEAIEAIKGDFEKILVITHVEELKDSFPQRIEVSKDGKGSRIYVL